MTWVFNRLYGIVCKIILNGKWGEKDQKKSDQEYMAYVRWHWDHVWISEIGL